jgi:hypothetical protein
VSTPDNNLLRFSLRSLLAATTVVALATGLAVVYPTVAILAAFATLVIAMQTPQPFLRYFPRTTLIGFGSVGIAFIGGGLYVSVTTGAVDRGFVGRIVVGSLFLLMTWLCYMMVKRREV